MSNSDLDEASYLELMKESATTGKSVQQILAERHGKDWSVINDPENKKKASKEIRDFLAANRWVVKPKQEEPNAE